MPDTFIEVVPFMVPHKENNVQKVWVQFQLGDISDRKVSFANRVLVELELNINRRPIKNYVRIVSDKINLIQN